VSRKFPFRLERLLDLKHRREKERAEALGRAMRDEAARREAMQRAEERLAESREQAQPPAGTTQPAGTLRNLGLTIAAAAQHVDAATTAQEEAGRALEGERQRYQEARRDRRVIERMREKRYEDWTREADRTEQREIDGVALDRHVRREED
jgi:flagellar FliJ protein